MEDGPIGVNGQSVLLLVEQVHSYGNDFAQNLLLNMEENLAKAKIHNQGNVLNGHVQVKSI